MRILHVTDSHQFSGGVKQVKLLMEGLRARGVEQALVVREGGTVAGAFEKAGFPVTAIRMFQDYDLGAAWRIAKIVSEFSPDVVHAHHPTAHALALIARIFKRFPLVVSRRVTHPVKPFPTSRWKYGSRLISRFICVSGAVKKELSKAGVEENRMAVIGSSTDFERFKPGPASSFVVKETGGGAKPVLGVIANYSSWKGHDVFMEALAMLKKRENGSGMPAAFMAGRDTDGAQARGKAAELGLTDHVRFLGWREDSQELLRVCRALVCPSLSGEGSSGAIREAFASGVPVIASSIDANRELVSSDRGWLFKPGDAASLADAMEAVLKAPAEERRLKTDAALKFVHENFSVETMVERTLRVYEESARNSRIKGTRCAV